jgi:hypothetical protein
MEFDFVAFFTRSCDTIRDVASEEGTKLVPDRPVQEAAEYNPRYFERNAFYSPAAPDDDTPLTLIGPEGAFCG